MLSLYFGKFRRIPSIIAILRSPINRLAFIIGNGWVSAKISAWKRQLKIAMLRPPPIRIANTRQAADPETKSNHLEQVLLL
jgi:hypothetical protein